jgi:hypothetical protein
MGALMRSGLDEDGDLVERLPPACSAVQVLHTRQIRHTESVRPHQLWD